jgi:hypothetical protein
MQHLGVAPQGHGYEEHNVESPLQMNNTQHGYCSFSSWGSTRTWLTIFIRSQ